VADEQIPEQLELRHYFQVLRRRLPIVILVTILLVGVTIAYDLVTTRVYATSADVLLGSVINSGNPSGSTNTQSPTVDVPTQIEVVQSSSVKGAVDKKLGAQSKDVSDVSVAQVGTTQVMRVTVQSASPAVAQHAVNLYAHTYVNNRSEQQINAALAAEKVVQQKLDQLKPQLNQLDQQIALAGNSPQANVLVSQRQPLQSQFDLYQQQLNQLQVQASLDQGGAQVLTDAGTPTTPVKPKPVRDGALALAIGLLLGIGVAFLAEYLDDKIYVPGDVQRYGAGLTVLAEIPAVPTWQNRRSVHVTSVEAPHSLPSEAYRRLRTSLLIIGLRQPVQTLLFTSSVTGEGKTTTVANLGVTMARAGRKVTLVDLDLHKPRLAEFFGVQNEPGFTSVLVGDVPISDAIQQVHIADDVPQLQILGPGPLPPNPSELLGTGRVTELLASLQASADLVFIDAPPLLPVTDALVLSRRVDGVILLVNAGATRHRHLSRATEMLEQADVPVLGAVLNTASAARRRRPSYGYGYAYDYGYRYGYGNGSKGGPALGGEGSTDETVSVDETR
jgi:succinoglycan biosynthesis transport protein ExoP